MRNSVRHVNAQRSATFMRRSKRWLPAAVFLIPEPRPSDVSFPSERRFLMVSRVVLILLLALPVALAGTQSATRSQVTFSEDVAPIVFSRCASCHRPGEAAPFSLLDYDDVKKRGKLIASVTQSRYMPPWLGSSEMGAFRDDRRLTD